MENRSQRWIPRYKYEVFRLLTFGTQLPEKNRPSNSLTEEFNNSLLWCHVALNGYFSPNSLVTAERQTVEMLVACSLCREEFNAIDAFKEIISENRGSIREEEFLSSQAGSRLRRRMTIEFLEKLVVLHGATCHKILVTIGLPIFECSDDLISTSITSGKYICIKYSRPIIYVL